MGKRTYGVLGSTSTVSSGDPGSGNGTPTDFFIVNASPCNLQYLYVYIANSFDPSTTDAWLQVFDVALRAPTLAGRYTELTGVAPKYVDKVTSHRFVWEPPLDSFVSIPADIGKHGCHKSDTHRGSVSMFLGAPFETGIVAVLSSTEFSFTRANGGALEVGYFMARINDLNCVPYYGDTGGAIIPPPKKR